MCITFLFTTPNPTTNPYKLILANNRDEFYKRATTEAELKIHQNLTTIHGTDLESAEHGTWLGLSQMDGTIKIGNLLNVTGEAVKEDPKSRGSIVMDFVKSMDLIEEHNRMLTGKFDDFNGFNFLSIEISQKDLKVFNACNVDGSADSAGNGYHGLSNSPFCTPYQKVVTGTAQFKALVESKVTSSKEILIESLFDLLKSNKKHLPCDELSKRRPQDAQIFSSINVKYPEAGYGTRNRSVILVDHLHNVDYVEERMTDENDPGTWVRKWLKIEGRVGPKGPLQVLRSFNNIVARLKAVL